MDGYYRDVQEAGLTMSCGSRMDFVTSRGPLLLVTRSHRGASCPRSRCVSVVRKLPEAADSQSGWKVFGGVVMINNEIGLLKK